MEHQKQTQPIVRRARGLQRITSILNAAEIVFVRMGYEEASTNHIATEAGISPGSLYQFFANKEEIAHALAMRYTEELQQAYDDIFSVEAASRPLPLWIDQIIDTLVAFHFAHPAFPILLNTPSSMSVASLTHELPKNLQIHFELGFQRRFPTVSSAQLKLSATVSVQFFKSVLSLILWTEEEAEQKLLVQELKVVLQRYLQPLLG